MFRFLSFPTLRTASLLAFTLLATACGEPVTISVGGARITVSPGGTAPEARSAPNGVATASGNDTALRCRDTVPQGGAGAMPIGRVLIPRRSAIEDYYWITFTTEINRQFLSDSVCGGALTYDDAHFAVMAALAVDEFCTESGVTGVYFNYYTDGGSAYMGKYYVPCTLAQQAIAPHRRNHDVWVIKAGYGLDGTATNVSVPDLIDEVVPQFRRDLIEQLIPECTQIEGRDRCPGDSV